MQIPLLQEIVIILGLSVGMILLFKRFKLPVLLGFLATGALCGPHGFGLVGATHEVELLAEVGVIFLLFVIGIEFSLSSLASVARTVLLGGTLQVAGTVALTAAVAHALGLAWPPSIFLGSNVSEDPSLKDGWISCDCATSRSKQNLPALMCHWSRASSAAQVTNLIAIQFEPWQPEKSAMRRGC